MLDVLMLTLSDNANTGWRFFKCLQRLGLNVLFFKGKLHPLLYPEQGLIHPDLAKCDSRIYQKVYSLKPLADAAKVVHYIASTVIETGADLKDKKVVMQHGGANYRVHHEKFNETFNPITSASIIQMPDLYGLGAKNEHLIYYPVDTDFIKPKFEAFDKVRIGHFPSNDGVKGTEDIVDTLKEFQGKYDFEYGYTEGVTKIPWIYNLERMRQFDVIVETFSLTAQGKKYGEWGNTALEAAALGKLVITNSLGFEFYKEEYGVDYCPLLIANTKDELRERIEYVLTAKPATIEKHKRQMREWVEKYHSMPVTAERLWNEVYREFFN